MKRLSSSAISVAFCQERPQLAGSGPVSLLLETFSHTMNCRLLHSSGSVPAATPHSNKGFLQSVAFTVMKASAYHQSEHLSCQTAVQPQGESERVCRISGRMLLQRSAFDLMGSMIDTYGCSSLDTESMLILKCRP